MPEDAKSYVLNISFEYMHQALAMHLFFCFSEPFSTIIVEKILEFDSFCDLLKSFL